MADYHAPDPELLLPPLLACLPTAFFSPKPPPALGPLLSPILRQRLQYASDVGGRDGWIPSLSWDTKRAARLAEKLEGLLLEPHPISGELEVDFTGRRQYKRLDEETLLARFELEQYGLLPVYVWCEQDTEEAGGPGWKLSELRTIEDIADDVAWYPTIGEANYAASLGQTQEIDEDDDDNDDDYWASYDRTPGRTPTLGTTAKMSPQTQPQRADSASAGQSGDDSYYASYDSVQPAMDGHDPDEERHDTVQKEDPRVSTSVDTPLVAALQPTAAAARKAGSERPIQRSLYPADPPRQPHDLLRIPSRQQSQSQPPQQTTQPLAPRPISLARTKSEVSVERLERSALAVGDIMNRAEASVRQFIGSDIRNLFRLARSVGMDVDEFRDVVGRELEVVSMLEDG